MNRIALDTGWVVTRCPATPPPSKTVAADSSSPLGGPVPATTPQAFEDTERVWHNAVVPGTVASTLNAAGEWDISRASDFDASDWWYRCDFAWAESNDTVLTFDGLATIAEVWLNNTLILRTDNMYRQYRVDVSQHIAPQNRLHIRFCSLDAELAKRRPRGSWKTRLVQHQQLRWFRTTLLGRMPGWSASPQTVGPWGAIAIETDDGSTIALERRNIRTSVETNENGTPKGRVDVLFHTDCVIESATLEIDGQSYSLKCEKKGDITVVHDSIVVDEVELWWPHTHGEQPLYRAAITMQQDSIESTIELGLISFRSITLDTQNGNFALQVNGVPVFCRGACWSTVDAIKLRGSRAQYLDALVLARDAGMNMLRVGGTMVYEDNAFYELCDELGILVWQDFMFANMDYPFADVDFYQNVQEEVSTFLQRVQTRACIALFCGNSEIQQQVSMLGMPKERWTVDFFQITLPMWCRNVRPDVAYWPSSPSGGAFPFHTNAGDAHYFGYGPYLRTFDDVRTSNVRFASESLAFAHVPDTQTVDLLVGGANGVGHHPAWKAAVPRDNGASWDFEDVRDHYLEELFHCRARDLRYSDCERYLALSRVVSGEIISRAMGYWRQPTSGCNGALLWFYKDLRPGAGWGIVDSTGRPKAAYYFMRRASLPITVQLSNEGLNGLKITALNESQRSVFATINISLYRAGEFLVASESVDIELQSHGGSWTKLADSLFEGFRDMTYSYRFGPPSHDLVVATLAQRGSDDVISDAYFFPVDLPATQSADIGLKAHAEPLSNGSYKVTISTQQFAQSVAVDADDLRPDDNYFHIPPNSSRSIILRPLPSKKRSTNSTNAVTLSGTVTALNCPTSVRILAQ